MKPLKECRLLVTPTSYGRYDPTLKCALEDQIKEVIYNETGKPLPSEKVSELLPGIDGYIAGLDFIDANALDSADELKIIARYGVGVDRVDMDAARKKGIIVSNTPAANARSVAELSIGLILSLARQIPAADQAVRKGDWPRMHGVSLAGKTVGILGFGAIGQLVANMLHPFNAKILVSDPFVDKDFVKSKGALLVDLKVVQAESDFLTIHVPLLPETENIVNKEFLLGMKKDAVIINSSRGGIINENDLYDILVNGHLRGAALDAYTQEPPNIEHPLFSLPQVIFTPHTGAHTDDATNRMGTMAMEECLRVLNGKQPKYQVR